jgi:prefoldin subunit 5
VSATAGLWQHQLEDLKQQFTQLSSAQNSTKKKIAELSAQMESKSRYSVSSRKP